MQKRAILVLAIAGFFLNPSTVNSEEFCDLKGTIFQIQDVEGEAYIAKVIVYNDLSSINKQVSCTLTSKLGIEAKVLYDHGVGKAPDVAEVIVNPGFYVKPKGEISIPEFERQVFEIYEELLG